MVKKGAKDAKKKKGIELELDKRRTKIRLVVGDSKKSFGGNKSKKRVRPCKNGYPHTSMRHSRVSLQLKRSEKEKKRP